MKWLMVLSIFLVGCTDRSICEMVRGAHAFYGQDNVRCNHNGFVRTENKFNIGECAVMFGTTELVSGITGLVLGYPGSYVSDLEIKIIDVEGGVYVTENHISHGGSSYVSRQRAEHVDSNYVRINCGDGAKLNKIEGEYRKRKCEYILKAKGCLYKLDPAREFEEGR